MTYDAGKAVGTYILDISDARRAAAELRVLFSGIRRDAQGIGAGAQGLKQVTAEEVKLAQALAKTATAEARKAAEINKRLSVDQKGLKLNADLALSEQKRQTEIARTAAAQDRAAQSALRRAAAEQRAARQGRGGLGPALPRTFAGFTPEGLGALKGVGASALGGFGVGLGLDAAIGGAVGAGQQALQARQTANALRIAAGEQQRFNDAVAIARRNQLLFGGSLQENQAALIGLANISRQTGVALSEIDSVVNQLKAADPAATFEDAQIALREFASGDVTSIAERFELPRKSLNAIIQAAPDAATRIKLLSDLLTQQGYSAATAASAIDQTQISYNLLGAVVDRFTTQAGTSLTNFFRESAEGLAVLIAYISSAGTSLDTFIRLIGEGVPVQEAANRATEAATIAFEDAINVNLASIPATNSQTDATNANTLSRLANADATNKQTQAEINHLAGLQRLRDQAAKTQNLVGGNQELGGPGRSGNDLADFDKEIERREAVAEAQRQQVEALETTAQRVARLRKEEQAADADSADRVKLQTERIQAERQLADEQEAARLKAEKAGQKGLKSGQTLARQEATLLDQRANRQEDYYLKLLQLQEDFQRRSARSQEDFDLQRARDTEDFERERRKLLAEGKIKEAQLLTEEFEREQKRNREDFNREQSREGQDFNTQRARQAADVGLDLGRISDRAAIRGVRVPAAVGGGAVPVGAPGAAPVLVTDTATSTPSAARALRIPIVIDGKALAEVLIDDIDALLAQGFVQTQITSPPQTGAVGAVGGARP